MRHRRFFVVASLACWLAAVVLADSSQADWIDCYTSPEAGIDSINRFLVISDIKDSTFFGRGIAPAGDVNQDGLQDVLICRAWMGYPTYTDSNCYMFYGGEPTSSGFQRLLTGLGQFVENIGDVNGDGYQDFGLTTLPSPRFELHFGGPSMDNVADFILPVWSLVSSSKDLDGDGNLEIALSTALNGGFVNIYDIEVGRDTTPEYVIPDTATGFGNRLAVGDINGDGQYDLAVSAYMNRDTNLVKFYWGGPSFDTIADYVIRSVSPWFGKLLVHLPDFNGDGYDDILISGGANEPYGVYFGGPEFDSVMDVTVNWGVPYFPPDAAAPAGDVNNDGYNDLVLSYLWENEIHIHLGGPGVDSLVDVFIDNGMIPGGQSEFGFELAGLGDFNGDGIDDFAVSSRTQPGCCWISEVNFFAGWEGGLVDVPDDEQATLPSSFLLGQNYPNPFNAATRISFELPVRSRVNLTVYNVLGERVALLLSQVLSPGEHTTIWDGTGDHGKAVSSGVYLYTLTVGKFSETRKMLLLK